MANNDLTNEIMRTLRRYTEEVIEKVDEAAEQTASEAVEKLKQTSPRRAKNGGKYASSWTKKKQGEKWVVHNKKHYRLTHLLEKGHAKVNGGRVAAKVHIAPVEQVAIDDFIERVERAVEG